MGDGTGTGTGTGGGGTGEAGAKGDKENGRKGGEEGGSADGKEGGKLGGKPRGDPKGGLDGSLDGKVGGAADGDPAGTLKGSATGTPGGTGERSAPQGSKPPENAGGKGNTQQSGGTRGGDGRGTQGTGKGAAAEKAEDAKGTGEGSGGKATVMDHVVKVAGYWNLEFSSDPKGKSGGIPGGMGKLASPWGQALYLALTVADIVLTVLSFGGWKAMLAGAKAALKGGMKLLASAGRKAMAAFSIKNLRSLALRASTRASIYADNVFKWLAVDYIAHGKFFGWMSAKGGWRKALVESGPGRWFLYGMNGGAGAAANGPVKKFLGFWPYQKTNVINNGATLVDKLDNFFHEGTHVVTDLLAYPINGLRNKLVGGQPVFAVVNYLDEVAAYTMGRLGSGRLHALPMAPLNAFTSVYSYYEGLGGTAMARQAMGWTVAGLTAIGGAIWGGHTLMQDDAPEPQAVPP